MFRNQIQIKVSPSRVKSAMREFMVFAALAMGMMAMTKCTTGCTPSVTESHAALDSGYVAAIVACAATAGRPGPYDAAADQACRRDVNARYGLCDGGCK